MPSGCIRSADVPAHSWLPSISVTRSRRPARSRGPGVDIAAGVAPVRAGPVRLQQVLVNLLTNAADAVATREDRRVRVSAHTDGNSVIMRVEDSGPGVPPEIAPRIFDPFFSTKGVGNGLGLGLSITYNIVKDFDGDITLVAGALGGAAFEVTLPAAQPQAEAAA
ncbi:MAG: hypothetical protein CVT70_19820 [Alphaproteobacteria bacterium HGW-Alphaproteobacteria-1]|nr:MAG: hypothetical protein CVT70_19820 [Alphaproteobacteria bacterium HGW-Alphaproteobacteria-1]